MERFGDIAALIYEICGVKTVLYAPGVTSNDKVKIWDLSRDIPPPAFIFWDELA